MRRLCAALIALMFCFAAHAEQPVIMEFSQEETRAFVEALFAAAAGTTYEYETELREDMTDEQLLERNAENALYREMTRPWLLKALGLEPEPVDDEEVNPTEPEWTAEDGYACFLDNDYGRAYLALLSEYGADSPETCMDMTRQICGAWLSEIDHAALAEMNEDYALWLYAPATQIDYPVVLGSDNKYYLKRLFNGEKNSAGTLFIDYRNLADLQDPNTLIYGHHMRNDSMFGTLTDYEHQAYYEAHPYMLVMNGDGIYLLEIFAGYTTTKYDHCYDIAISDENDLMEFLAEAAEKSDFAADAEAEKAAKLVTLSTCAYAFENARYIVIAKVVPISPNVFIMPEESVTTADGG